MKDRLYFIKGHMQLTGILLGLLALEDGALQPFETV
jgi:hypothetical protein